MSQAEERSTAPQGERYRAPGATVLGSVEELTAGNGGDYQDGGAYRGLAAGRDDEQASEDATGGAAPPRQDDAEE
ncbi:MAG TPA: hypothetical protein VF615_16000 [Longimicrobiaceae bacterium]|jgi:hypothetical protein